VEPDFLTTDQVAWIHKKSIEDYGGSHGTRDETLLESAVMAPQASFGGVYLNVSLEEFAASYWLSLTMNHPFIDGNKRTALWSCSTFLNMNGFKLDLTESEAEEMTLDIAKGLIRTKEDLLRRFKIVPLD